MNSSGVVTAFQYVQMVRYNIVVFIEQGTYSWRGDIT